MYKFGLVYCFHYSVVITCVTQGMLKSMFPLNHKHCSIINNEEEMLKTRRCLFLSVQIFNPLTATVLLVGCLLGSLLFIAFLSHILEHKLGIIRRLKN